MKKKIFLSLGFIFFVVIGVFLVIASFIYKEQVYENIPKPLNLFNPSSSC